MTRNEKLFIALMSFVIVFLVLAATGIVGEGRSRTAHVKSECTLTNLVILGEADARTRIYDCTPR